MNNENKQETKVEFVPTEQMLKDAGTMDITDGFFRRIEDSESPLSPEEERFKKCYETIRKFVEDRNAAKASGQLEAFDQAHSYITVDSMQDIHELDFHATLDMLSLMVSKAKYKLPGDRVVMLSNPENHSGTMLMRMLKERVRTPLTIMPHLDLENIGDLGKESFSSLPTPAEVSMNEIGKWTEHSTTPPRPINTNVSMTRFSHQRPLVAFTTRMAIGIMASQTNGNYITEPCCDTDYCGCKKTDASACAQKQRLKVPACTCKCHQPKLRKGKRHG